MLEINIGDYLSLDLSGAPLQSRPLTLPTNNRLGWRGLPVTNTVDYFKKSVNYNCKKFYNIDTRMRSSDPDAATTSLVKVRLSWKKEQFYCLY
jgi:hypothetical protein